ncbi:FecR family protein [Rhodohalobacter sp. SW132]|uniref:FecR family protein n=1 Tax=Rhodohalobacter sp. SW132 TaxID=2293433 RepID=UPI000E2601DD|nr:FecR family protein [Rhodohalobacter sp. SW132]REL33060.1 FecR family protein [Rhodohalobacter sp. SW132]
MEDNYLEDLLSDDSFLRFIKKKASAAEHKHWVSWLKENSSHQILYDQAMQLIRFTSKSERNIPDPIIEINKIEKLIKREGSYKVKNPIKKLNQTKHRKKNYWPVAAAAVAMIVLSMYTIFENFEVIDYEVIEIPAVQTSSEFFTSFGEKVTLQLSDGSSIILNANSHLKYAFTGSAKGTRDIDIYLQGEAWFDIQPVNADGKDNRKIHIHTHDGIIEVLGTTLNVQTSKKGTRTVLEKGIIKIESYQENGVVESNSMIIEPGQMAWYMSGLEKIEVKEVDPDIYTSWIRDVWVFDQTPLTDVAARIEYVFGVKVIFPFENIQEKTISGSISSENLQLIMEGISEAVDISVAHLNNNIIIGG